MSVDVDRTDLQSWPEVPSIAHFCSLFRQAFDLIEFDIQELEESLLLAGTANEDEDEEEPLVDSLIVRLLAGCLPMYRRRISLHNYSSYLRQLLQTKREEAEEDGLQQHKFDSPFGDGDEEKEFGELDLRDRVGVVHQLCEYRLEAEDVPDKIKNLEAGSLRVDPLGTDSEGVTLWYFYGTRLYKEVVVQVDPKKDNKRDKKKNKKDKKDKKKKKKKSKDHDKDSSDDGDSTTSRPAWSVACLSEEDWEELTEKYRKSKKKADRALHQTLNESFLPEIKKMFAEKAREDKRRMMMAMPKRTSTRIDKLRREQEKRDRALAFILEEENLMEEEKMGKVRRDKEQRERQDREERQKQREMMKEMRAKRAAERMVESEFANEVKDQRQRQKKQDAGTSGRPSKRRPASPAAGTGRAAKKRRPVYNYSSGSDLDISPVSSREPSPDLDSYDDKPYSPPQQPPSKAQQTGRTNFANALIRAGAKSTKDSTLDKLPPSLSSSAKQAAAKEPQESKPVRKTAGLLLQTAGKGLLNKMKPNNDLSSFSTTSGISFGLYGGHLPVDPSTISTKLDSVFDEKRYSQEVKVKDEMPAKKVFSNWGSDFFKKNLDFRANTNKILEKMQVANNHGLAELKTAGSSFGGQQPTSRL